MFEYTETIMFDIQILKVMETNFSCSAEPVYLSY